MGIIVRSGIKQNANKFAKLYVIVLNISYNATVGCFDSGYLWYLVFFKFDVSNYR